MIRIDARGMRCPWPALRLARALREAGDAVEIMADDPIAEREMEEIAAAAGWRLRAIDGQAFIFRAERATK